MDGVAKVENLTGEDFAWLHLSLTPLDVPEGVRMTGGRFDLGPQRSR